MISRFIYWTNFNIGLMLLESLRLRQLKIIRKFHAFCLNMSRRLLLASGGVSPCQQRLSFSCWILAYLRKTVLESSEIFVEHTRQEHRGKTSTHAPAWAFPVSFSVTRSSQSLPRALSFILCAACGSVVLLYAARVFDYFVVIEIAFMDN